MFGNDVSIFGFCFQEIISHWKKKDPESKPKVEEEEVSKTALALEIKLEEPITVCRFKTDNPYPCLEAPKFFTQENDSQFLIKVFSPQFEVEQPTSETSMGEMQFDVIEMDDGESINKFLGGEASLVQNCDENF